MSIDNMRVGKTYFLRNLGDSTSFMILEGTGEKDYIIKDLITLEVYPFKELTKFGKGKDFELNELN
ncbi:MAG: hypothetical protein ACFCUU_02450 [Cyclobacteriaceae bacterium]